MRLRIAAIQIVVVLSLCSAALGVARAANEVGVIVDKLRDALGKRAVDVPAELAVALQTVANLAPALGWTDARKGLQAIVREQVYVELAARASHGAHAVSVQLPDRSLFFASFAPRSTTPALVYDGALRAQLTAAMKDTKAPLIERVRAAHLLLLDEPSGKALIARVGDRVDPIVLPLAALYGPFGGRASLDGDGEALAKKLDAMLWRDYEAQRRKLGPGERHWVHLGERGRNAEARFAHIVEIAEHEAIVGRGLRGVDFPLLDGVQQSPQFAKIISLAQRPEPPIAEPAMEVVLSRFGTSVAAFPITNEALLAIAERAFSSRNATLRSHALRAVVSLDWHDRPGEAMPDWGRWLDRLRQQWGSLVVEDALALVQMDLRRVGELDNEVAFAGWLTTASTAADRRLARTAIVQLGRYTFDQDAGRTKRTQRAWLMALDGKRLSDRAEQDTASSVLTRFGVYLASDRKRGEDIQQHIRENLAHLPPPPNGPPCGNGAVESAEFAFAREQEARVLAFTIYELADPEVSARGKEIIEAIRALPAS